MFHYWSCVRSESPPALQRVAAILKQRERLLPLIFGGNSLWLIRFSQYLSHTCPHFPTSALFTINVLLFILPILYLYILWSLSTIWFKVKETALPLQMPEQGNDKAVTAQHWDNQAPWNLKNKWKSSYTLMSHCFWPWNKYLPITWKKWSICEYTVSKGLCKRVKDHALLLPGCDFGEG